MRLVLADNLLLEHAGLGTYQVDLQPHLGLISLIAVLRSHGIDGRLYDPKQAIARGELALDERLYRNMALAILERAPDYVGFTSLGCNFICTAKVAHHLKAVRPDLPILLGGPHASILDQSILSQFPQFDVIVRHEAENTLVPLLNALQDGSMRAVSGITFRDHGGVIANPATALIANLDELPRPAYDAYPIEDFKVGVLRVEAGRGCPFSCTFCSTASFFGRRYRLKSADKLVGELDWLHERYGISHFALTHDLFTVNKAKVREFCDLVAGRGYTWTCSARMDCVDPGLLEEMYEAGCRSIYYGVETGSERMQQIVDKHLDLALFAPTLDATRRVGLEATTSFITGFPTEEQRDQDETLDLIGSCFSQYPAGVTVQLHLLTPEPGTRLMSEFAALLDYDGHISDFNFPTLEADDAVVMRQHPSVFMNHFFYRGTLERGRHIFVTSVHPVLYKLGFGVLRHLLTYYDGRYSQLIGSLFDWASLESPDAVVDADLVCRYIEAAWTPEHYLTSLVRYLLAASRLGTSRLPGYYAVAAPGNCHNGPSKVVPKYVLGKAAILRDLHDCSTIVELLEHTPDLAGAAIPLSLRTARQSYLLFRPNAEGRTVRNFRVDGAALELLEYLQAPRSKKEYASYAAQLAGRTRPPAQAMSLLSEMVRIGVVEHTRTHAGECEPAGARR